MNNSKVFIVISVLLLGICTWLFVSDRSSQQNNTFSSTQKGEIEKIIHDYLIEKPEVLVKASQELQRKNQEKQAEAALTAISESADELLDSKSPVMGNPDGDVILIKFLDYQCGHCKKMEKVVAELIKDNPNLKVIIKALPIFGEESVFATKAALASAGQGKFPEMHQALLNEKEKLSEEKVIDLAKENGLDVKKLQEDMEADSVNEEIDGVYNLAMKLSVKGTPFFVVMGDPERANDTALVVPGAAHKTQLQALINRVKENQN